MRARAGWVPRSETRQVREIATVRRLSISVALAACPAWLATLLGAAALADAGLGPPAVLIGTGAALAAFGTGVAGWARPAVLPAAAIVSAALTAARVFAPGSADGLLLVTAGVSSSVASGAALRTATDVVPPALRSAALGWIATATGGGMAPAGFVALLGPGPGEIWLAAFVCVGAAFAVAAHRGLVADTARAASRTPAPGVEKPALLDVRDVHLSFGRTVALAGVSLTVRPGEILGVLGTNGAGKTTLLRAVAGFARPGRGVVLVDGEDVTGMLPEELALRGVTFVDGSRPVFGDLTVLENLRVAGFATHRRRRAFRHATRTILDLFPVLDARRHAHAGTLSGGEQRLLALAQTMYTRPRLLLADELTLGLDDATVADLQAVVRALAAAGTAVAVVEHRVRLAAEVATRVVFLDAGRVRYDGDPEGLLRRDDLLRAVLVDARR